MVREQKSFRLDPRKIKLLEAMTLALGRRDGTNYSQAQVIERALQCLWEREFDKEDDDTSAAPEEAIAHTVHPLFPGRES
jgi:hypothetical protein